MNGKLMGVAVCGMLAAVAGVEFAASQMTSSTAPLPYTQHNAADIERRVQALTEKARTAPTGIATEGWEHSGDHFAMLAVRVHTGGGEVHQHMGDYFFVLHGHATELVGGTLQDAKETDAGELRGPAVQNGESHTMGPGDFIHVQAGTPHQTIMGSEPFAYLVIKVAE